MVQGEWAIDNTTSLIGGDEELNLQSQIRFFWGGRSREVAPAIGAIPHPLRTRLMVLVTFHFSIPQEKK